MNEVLGHYQLYIHGRPGLLARKVNGMQINPGNVSISTRENNYLNSPSGNYQAYRKKRSGETEVHLYGTNDLSAEHFNLSQVNRLEIYSPVRKVFISGYQLRKIEERLRFFVKQDNQLIPVTNVELKDEKLSFYSGMPLHSYPQKSFGATGGLSPQGLDVFFRLAEGMRITQFDTEVELPLEKLIAVNYNQVNLDKSFTSTVLLISLLNIVVFGTLFATQVIRSSY